MFNVTQVSVKKLNGYYSEKSDITRRYPPTHVPFVPCCCVNLHVNTSIRVIERPRALAVPCGGCYLEGSWTAPLRVPDRPKALPYPGPFPIEIVATGISSSHPYRACSRHFSSQVFRGHHTPSALIHFRSFLSVCKQDPARLVLLG